MNLKQIDRAQLDLLLTPEPNTNKPNTEPKDLANLAYINPSESYQCLQSDEVNNYRVNRRRAV
uniref:Uncharacterized protein n=1 Tax=uncultured prokaryote TaxID=198431 RepID=A0A0H5QCK0_9ZZZZ|nr:hypothetical protein [uncultured prokaryote]